MKKNFHPELHEVTAHCACGAQYKMRSTAGDLKVTLCSQCHPYFTGAHKFVDTAGRIEKFQKRYEKGAQKEAANAVAKEVAAASKAKNTRKKSK
jgi:large subunit ribosomal protein L31